MFDGTGIPIDYFMAAIEMIHTYLHLIHDDLPAMDNDDIPAWERQPMVGIRGSTEICGGLSF